MHVTNLWNWAPLCCNLVFVPCCTRICEVWAKIMSLEPLEVGFELKNTFWKTQNSWCPLERWILRSSVKYELPAYFCRHGIRSSGEVHARVGSYVDRPSARVPDFTLERNFDASSTFCRLGVRSSGEPCNEAFRSSARLQAQTYNPWQSPTCMCTLTPNSSRPTHFIFFIIIQPWIYKLQTKIQEKLTKEL